MSDQTSIEWTDATWNPIGGCTRVDQGCKNCYAEVMAARFSDPGQWGHGLAHRVKLPDGTTDHRWTGQMRLNEAALTRPLHWRKPRRIFVNSTSDLFHESVPDDWIDRVFAVMALCPQHTFQVLTKRAGNMQRYFTANPGIHIRTAMQAIAPQPIVEMNWPLPNVWLGTSISDQNSADARIPDLLATPAAIRFISAEPLLGPVSLRCIPWTASDRGFVDALTGKTQHPETRARYPNRHPDTARLDWVITGGESGPGARPMHPDWPRALHDQCEAAGVAHFFKQWGEHDQHGHRVGKRAAGRLLDGEEYSQFPGDVLL